jgi:hypothetical protein
MKMLITSSRLNSYGGSEIVVLELVEWFITKGWQVTLLCQGVGELMLQELSGFLSQRQLTLLKSSTQISAIKDFDLVWITHNVWPEALLAMTKKQPAGAKVVTIHMGSLESRETSVLSHLENALADRILVVSGRTRDRMIEFGLTAELIEVFDNPVPTAFLERTHCDSTGMKSVLFISNHLPRELVEVSQQLRSNGTFVTKLGLRGDRFERLTPELLHKYDAVVTIGKSTQYCLVSGIPVYSYDHFGGAGWLSDENFTFEAHNNFTGYRTQRKLVAEQISSEIRDGFDAARLWSKDNKVKFANHYSLTRQAETLLSSLQL